MVLHCANRLNFTSKMELTVCIEFTESCSSAVLAEYAPVSKPRLSVYTLSHDHHILLLLACQDVILSLLIITFTLFDLIHTKGKGGSY